MESQEDSQEVGCGVSGFRGSMEHLEGMGRKGDCKWQNTFFVNFLWGVWCAGEG